MRAERKSRVSWFFIHTTSDYHKYRTHIIHRQNINSHLSVISLHHHAKWEEGKVLKPSPEVVSGEVMGGCVWNEHLYFCPSLIHWNIDSHSFCILNEWAEHLHQCDISGLVKVHGRLGLCLYRRDHGTRAYTHSLVLSSSVPVTLRP